MERFVVSRPRCDASCATPGDPCSFQVAWAINPHMRVGAVSPVRARAQHAELVATLRSLGAHVHEVPFVHGAFDCVFTKDCAVLVEQADGAIEALVASPRHEERRIEQRARTLALVELGVRVVGAARTALEGGDVVVLPGARGAFLGHGFRSDPSSAEDLARLVGDVTCLDLVDPRLYHLDMALAVLDDGTALVCDEALTRASLAAVESHPAVRDVVHVPLAEALAFGVNLVQVGRAIVMAGDAPSARRALLERGHRVARVALDEFHHAGGSAACLTARVHRKRNAAERSVAA